MTEKEEEKDEWVIIDSAFDVLIPKKTKVKKPVLEKKESYYDLKIIQNNNSNSDINMNLNINTNDIFFDIDEYLKQNLLSYNKSSESVWKQFCLDFHRQKIYINDKCTSEMSDIFDFMKQFDNNKCDKYTIDDMEMDIDIIFIMLMTQASFCLPFQCMSQLFDRDDIHVISTTSDKIIKLYTDDEIMIKFQTQFSIFDIQSESEIKSINVELIINTNIKKNKYKNTNTHKLFPKYGYIYFKLV
jgi:hypothetical protein